MKGLHKVKVLGTGHYVPERVVTNEYLSTLVETSDEWIVQRTGISQRRFAAPEEATSDLCAEAGRRALEASGVKPEDIDMVLLATCSPDHLVANTASIVQHKLGIPRSGGFEIQCACSGFLNSFITAWQFLRSGGFKTALVIGGETLSKILNMQDRGSCIIFGDGAGAAVIQSYEGEGDSDILSFSMGQDGSGADKLLMPAGGVRIPATHETVEAKQHTIHMQGKEIYKFAVRTMSELILREMRENNWSNEDVSIVIPHQVNLRILESASDKTGIALDRMFINIDKYGNTSAGSVPIALDEAVRAGRIKRGDKVILVAFGAGLTWSSVSLVW